MDNYKIVSELRIDQEALAGFLGLSYGNLRYILSKGNPLPAEASLAMTHLEQRLSQVKQREQELRNTNLMRQHAELYSESLKTQQLELKKELELKVYRLRQKLADLQTRQHTAVDLHLAIEDLLQNFPPLLTDAEDKKNYLRLMLNKTKTQIHSSSIQKQQKIRFQLVGLEAQLEFLENEG